MLSSESTASSASKPVRFSVLKFPDTHARQENPDLPPVPTVVLNTDTCEVLKSDQHGQVAIKWHERPRAVLMLKKIHEPQVTSRMREVGRWLQREHGLEVFVEPAVHDREISEFRPYHHENPDVPVDFCICLGGDGTLLYLNSLFQGKRGIPPIASFAFGSLGFLTPFDESEIESVVNEVMNSVNKPLFLTLRTRFEASIVRNGAVDASYQVLNEVTIGRGGNSQPAWMELFVGGKLVTSSQADGLIISTPTGSTAYSMSAGGSMVAPSVPAILITPICPHTLSFRPILVPDDTEVKVRVPEKRWRRLEEPQASSGSASGISTIQQPMAISFDGRSRVMLKPGDQVSIRASPYPVPAIKLAADDNEWFHSIRSKLHWNLHLREKPDYGYDDVDDDTQKPSKL